MKFYNKYPYQEDLEIQFTEIPNSIYYVLKKVEIKEDIFIKVIEQKQDNKVLSIIYRIAEVHHEKLVLFHDKNYELEYFQVEKKISSFTFHYSVFRKQELIKYLFLSLNDKLQPKISYELSKNHELLEYREEFYDDLGNQIKKKLFFPKPWVIHEDDHF